LATKLTVACAAFPAKLLTVLILSVTYYTAFYVFCSIKSAALSIALESSFPTNSTVSFAKDAAFSITKADAFEPYFRQLPATFPTPLITFPTLLTPVPNYPPIMLPAS